MSLNFSGNFLCLMSLCNNYTGSIFCGDGCVGMSVSTSILCESHSLAGITGFTKVVFFRYTSPSSPWTVNSLPFFSITLYWFVLNVSDSLFSLSCFKIMKSPLFMLLCFACLIASAYAFLASCVDNRDHEHLQCLY